MSELTMAHLQQYVVGELDRILEEMGMPFGTGLIPRSLTQHLRGVVAEWPDIQIQGIPAADYLAAGGAIPPVPSPS